MAALTSGAKDKSQDAVSRLEHRLHELGERFFCVTVDHAASSVW